MTTDAPLIAILDDEPEIRRLLASALEDAGFRTASFARATEFEAGLRRMTPDACLIDLGLPDRDGLALVHRLATQSGTTVIIISGRAQVQDRVTGLELGADDYVVKPFSARELLARVAAVLRRSAPPPAEVLTMTVGDGTIDLKRREVRWPGGERADLSETETAVLAHLVAHRDRPVSREELLGRVWGVGASGGETRAVDMLVNRLRTKLRSPDAVLTVRNAGYMAGPSLGAS